MQLNYQLQAIENWGQTLPIVMIHGLFGNLNNLRTIASNLAQYACIIQIDLRNHGRSPHMQSMTYIDMAKDILNLLDQLLIKKSIIIGHSMGGKVAMTLCMLAAQYINKIVIIDIAPVQYNIRDYDSIFNAIDYVNKSKVKNRTTAMQLMQKYISNQSLIAFLAKSFIKGSWSFNFSSIKNNLSNISSWCSYSTWWGPSLFIKGENSSYLDVKYIHDIYHQFPQTCIHTVPNSGHWVHHDNPIYIANIIREFIFY